MTSNAPSVLCPIDFSEFSRVALAHAAAIANHFGARLIVLSVDDPLLTRPQLLRGSCRRLLRKRVANCGVFAAIPCRRLPAPAPSSTTWPLGSPRLRSCARRTIAMVT